MIVIKRDGRETLFDRSKITSAIMRAFDEVSQFHSVGDKRRISNKISDRLKQRYKKRCRAISVEEIQDDVEIELMKEEEYEVARAYIRYRNEHALGRSNSDLDKKILTLCDGVNEVVIQENSNKNPILFSTQRDYIAGEVSRDITNRLLLPKDIAEAHEEGIIHFHEYIVA